MIDLSYYEGVADGDKDFIIQMVRTFIEDVPLMMEKIRIFYKSDNFTDLAKQTHKLKASWSMTRLDVSALESLEKEARAGNKAEMHEKIEKIEAIFSVAMKEMQEKLEILINPTETFP